VISRTVPENQRVGPGHIVARLLQRLGLKGAERLLMRQKLRIIKHGTSQNTMGPSNDQVEKTESQSHRDTAKIVKSWISEWQQRRRSPQRPSSTN
jgi:hypothetical protein